ncbi:uncharacterized protein JN550_011255 [Neoarthrinium moseri]|uniref:uncharacterized protein n=1 Tax=Neoarthrinium moseri TaxID=1658444 RepID=UPI001FDE5CE9|nr:uncharacterized protein JN550_011255 [Neoarthrinium moseri]KAI1860793.1 hypothetical protein JN550_011255 [Neoarthrinium moseri]
MKITIPELEVENITNGETVHQKCLLLTGQCNNHGQSDDFISIEVTDIFGQASPVQNWPIASGKWKALLMLNSGNNKIRVKLNQSGTISKAYELDITYQPLLQLPPLHLAILVAKDSPLLVDCPPAKRGAISTTHSSLDGAITKFRMAAYMWQALTAEDLRLKGLGRRCFRLDEEWGIDTTTCSSLQTDPGSRAYAGTAAKVHIVRSDKTLAQLRDASVAQQNPHGRRRDDLHKFFEQALKAHGAPFTASERPVVAGLILDSHYSIDQDLILGHAALGCHKPDGISLGVFGSHTTYSWPRFLEEIPACLLDQTPTGSAVGNDNGECGTMRGACFVGQGAFLHEVGHAFGADHTTGIMARGYSKDWSKNFVAHQSDSNDAKWALEDALRFKLQPHFKLPADLLFSPNDQDSAVQIGVRLKDGDTLLEVSCQFGIAQIAFKRPTGENIQAAHFRSPFETDACAIRKADFDGKSFCVSYNNLEAQFDRTEEIAVFALGMNGRKRVCNNIWKLLAELPSIRIPGYDMLLGKKSVKSDGLNSDTDQQYHRWATLLKRKQSDGSFDHANAIDLRVGCTMDGAVVHYDSGVHVNCGPVSRHGRPHTFGGHASEKRSIPHDAAISKVEINRVDSGWGSLNGIRMTLDNGSQWGELNSHGKKGVEVLQPADDERIVGFYGKSEKHSGFTYEFGIITAKNGEELPDICYQMAELQNTDDQVGVHSSRPALTISNPL